MTLSKRVLLIIGMMIIALVSAACGGGGGGGDATGVTKTFFEALLKADAAGLRNNICAGQAAAFTDDVIASLGTGLSGTGASIDTSGVTYTYDDAAKVVNLGGVIKATVNGITEEAQMSEFPLNSFPVVEENGAWKVCLDLSALMGG